MPGFAIYFGAFEGFKTLFGVAHGKQEIKLSKGQTALRKFVAGGLAGVVTWTIAFPADTIKTKMQTAKQGDNASTMQVFAKVVRQEGFLSLYRGIHVQLLRAFPNGACSFFVLDTVKEKLRRL